MIRPRIGPARRRLRPAWDVLEDRRLPSTLPPGFTETTVASGLDQPTAMEIAPDGRIFVAEQGGQLRVIEGGRLLPTPFLSLNVDSTGERGLLGVAFDPQFAADHFVYVYYTVPGTPAHNRVSRFTANGDVAVPGSEVPILDLDPLSTATNHNGGSIHFGLDGKLYVAVGENGNGANAQTLNNRLGKLLRINPDGSIPPDNPFFNVATGPNRAIWALGLRNPFSFAVQPGTGRIFIDDVGENTFEEVDDGVAGANYGWPVTEGPTNDPRFKGPLYFYAHGPNEMNGCAITGGTFYDPASPQFPAGMVGDYFFSDLCGSYIKRLDPATGVASDFATDLPPFPVDMKVDAAGNLYYLARGAGGPSGVVARISFPAPVGQAPVVTRDPTDQAVSSGQPATFSVVASGTAPLLYQWQRNGVNIPGANGPTFTIPTVAAGDNGAQFQVVVANAFGATLSRAATLTVSVAAPAGSPLVRALYFDLLHRPADPVGLAVASQALAQGLSPGALAAFLLNSDERHRVVVAEDYLRFLGRFPSPAELAAGADALDSGQSQEDVLARLLGSPEYLARHGRTARSFVQSLYRDVLGRDPSRAELSVARRAGTTAARMNLARGLLAGDEAHAALVSGWYVQFLRRPAAPAEQAAGVAAFRAGASRDQVLAAILGTPEYVVLATILGGQG
jgi:glucose/arabinose dehydrogenase